LIQSHMMCSPSGIKCNGALFCLRKSRALRPLRRSHRIAECLSPCEPTCWPRVDHRASRGKRSVSS
jgi:hypothetical protein